MCMQIMEKCNEIALSEVNDKINLNIETAWVLGWVFLFLIFQHLLPVDHLVFLEIEEILLTFSR